MDALNTQLPKEKQVFGEEHPNFLRALFYKSHGLNVLGNVKAAHELASQVLAQQIRILGEEHPETKDTQELLENIQLNKK